MQADQRTGREARAGKQHLCPRAQAAGGKRGAAQAAREGCLEALWGAVVEGDLFASSNLRKYLAFQLFTILLPHLRRAPLSPDCRHPATPRRLCATGAGSTGSAAGGRAAGRLHDAPRRPQCRHRS